MDPSKISIRTNHGIHLIECGDICYFQADGRYTWIFLNTGENYLVAKVLKQYEDLLCSDKFFRIHKSYLVNLEYISHFTINNGRTITMHNNTQLIISKRRCKKFAQKVMKLFPAE